MGSCEEPLTAWGPRHWLSHLPSAFFSLLAGSSLATSAPNSSFGVESRSALRISSKEDTWLNTHCSFGALQAGNS